MGCGRSRDKAPLAARDGVRRKPWAPITRGNYGRANVGTFGQRPTSPWARVGVAVTRAAPWRGRSCDGQVLWTTTVFSLRARKRPKRHPLVGCPRSFNTPTATRRSAAKAAFFPQPAKCPRGRGPRNAAGAAAVASGALLNYWLTKPPYDHFFGHKLNAWETKTEPTHRQSCRAVAVGAVTKNIHPKPAL